MNIQIFHAIFILQVFLGIKSLCKCLDIDLYKIIIFIFHHILDVYVFFGFLINQTRREFMFHLALIISLLIHWFSNDYDCILTTYLNELCGYPKKQWFQSIMFKLHEVTGIYYLHTYWLIALILYDLWMIFKK